MGKLFIEVEANFNTEGIMTPVEIIWEDGRIFHIARVLDIRRAASLKAGGQGIRYRCIINGQEKFLFFEDNKWFVETNR